MVKNKLGNAANTKMFWNVLAIALVLSGYWFIHIIIKILCLSFNYKYSTKVGKI
jgi:hypothetical protein